MNKTWRRRIVEIACCLGVGVALTVVLAWASALWAPPPSLPPFKIMGIVEKDGSLRPLPQTVAGGRFGFHIEMNKHVVRQGGGTSIGLEDDGDRLAAGWPWLALECDIVYNTHQPPAGRLRHEQIGWNASGGPWLIDGVSVSGRKWLRAQAWRFLPLRPRPWASPRMSCWWAGSCGSRRLVGAMQGWRSGFAADGARGADIR